jgi:MoaA/NifB/PqqE/SkfB family radical SAM enzyme
VRLGFSEVSLVVVILLIFAPDVVPKLMRRLGYYIGVLRKLGQDVREEVVGPMMGETPSTGGGNRPHGQPDGLTAKAWAESPEGKLGTLDLFSKDYQPQYAAKILPWLVDDDPRVRERARTLLMLDPLFAFERRSIKTAREPERPLHYVEYFFSGERIGRLSDLLSRLPEDRVDRYLDSICWLPGIQNLDIPRIFSGSREALGDKLLSSCRQREEERYPLQVSIAPSYRCDMGCGYCFSRALERKFPLEMTTEEFGGVLDLVRSSAPLRRVGFLGGEPTSCSRIEEYVGELEKRNLSFYLATNGLAPNDLFRRIVRSNRLEMVTFHVEKDGFYREGQTDTLSRNISAVNQDSVQVNLRYNLVDKDFREWSFLEKYLGLLSRPSVSFAVVFPSRVEAKSMVSLNDLEAFRPKIMSLVRYLSERMSGRSHRIDFAKPFPPCLFDESELKFLLQNARLRNICEIDKNNFTNNICVNADLSYYPCMALNSDEFRFPRIKALNSLDEVYYEAVRNVVNSTLLPQCGECLLHIRGVCQPACYAYL